MKRRDMLKAMVAVPAAVAVTSKVSLSRGPVDESRHSWLPRADLKWPIEPTYMDLCGENGVLLARHVFREGMALKSGDSLGITWNLTFK